MATEYTERYADPGDAEDRVLRTLADGNTYVFMVVEVTSTDDGPADLSLRVATNSDGETVKSILTKTLRALP